MLDIGRISSRKWAIALLVVLCVSAVIFIAPWMLSVFYDSEPYESWDEELRFRTEETEGNTTLWCSPGPCVACTASEKADSKFKCSPTGYHRAQRCAVDKDSIDAIPQAKEEGKAGVTKDPILGKDQKSGNGDKQLSTVEGDSTTKGRALIAEGGSEKTVSYKTCIPQDVKEKLSVFGFEGVVLVCLLLSAPAVHYRKKRSQGISQGMQRIPSIARF